MAQALRPIGHEDRLSIVDHLDELRTRLIICLIALGIAFGICFWQNQPLLNLLNRALPTHQDHSANHLSGQTKDLVTAQRYLSDMSVKFHQLCGSRSQSASDQQAFCAISTDAAGAAKALPQTVPKQLPVTLGVGEPFTTTLTVAGYFALLFALPVILYQIYAFVIPALNPHERRVALPVMIAAPILFLTGAAFAYLVVLPPAVHFLQGYNSGNFDILVQAKTYYTFQMLTMLGIGLAFQLPLVLLALQRIGAINGSTLTRNWRYATVIIAVIAAAMPGADPVTTGLEMLPLVLLYLASIVMLKIADRRAAARAATELADDGLGLT